MSLSDTRSLCGYNAHDCLITVKLLQELLPRLGPDTARVSAFEHAMQGPALSMMLRGIRRDPGRTDEALRALRRDAKEAQASLPEAAGFTFIKSFAPSPQQVAAWFYTKLGLPKKKNKKGAISTDEECLLRLKMDKKVPEEVISQIDTILELRGLDKDHQVLTQKADPDGRVRFSWNVGATETGRWSASKNPMGGGGNPQGLAHHVRKAFVPDTGKVMIYADLRQAESNVVSHLSGDEAYIAAHAGGDTHGMVARRLWPDLGEGTDIRVECPEWGPKQPWRQWAKKVQHAQNYRQSPFGVSRLLKIKLEEARKIARDYFKAFPGIQGWHAYKTEQLALNPETVTPMGRVRQFLGRPWDEDTVKEAIAHEPQSTVGDILNVGLLRVWWELERANRLECLAQGHDAILTQTPEAQAEETAREIAGLMRVPVEVTDIGGVTRTMEIGTDWKIGTDWAMVS